MGGAVISLYADDPAADEIRPTMDIDITLNIVSLQKWIPLQEELIALGFYPNPAGRALCNYLYNGTPVDIMMAHTTALGPANRWFPIGFEQLWTVKAREEEVNIFSPHVTWLLNLKLLIIVAAISAQVTIWKILFTF